MWSAGLSADGTWRQVHRWLSSMISVTQVDTKFFNLSGDICIQCKVIMESVHKWISVSAVNLSACLTTSINFHSVSVAHSSKRGNVILSTSHFFLSGATRDFDQSKSLQFTIFALASNVDTCAVRFFRRISQSMYFHAFSMVLIADVSWYLKFLYFV